MRTFNWLFGCAALVIAHRPATAQLPSVPGAVPPVAVPGVPTVPAAPVAPTRNVFSFLLPSPQQRTTCQAKLAACPPVQLLNSLLKPIGALSGGLVPPLIPPGASAANLAKPQTSAAGAAARIQTQEADAKARREAVRYLGTVDCRYYPEAAAALANALRTDPSECVRYEAALALNRSCCCTQKTVAALKAAASGGSDDQNPPECSERVRAAAESALMHCATAVPPVPPLPLEKPIPSAAGPVPADQWRPAAAPVARPAPVPALSAQPVTEIPAGQRGLLQITRHVLLPEPAPAR